MPEKRDRGEERMLLNISIWYSQLIIATHYSKPCMSFTLRKKDRDNFENLREKKLIDSEQSIQKWDVDFFFHSINLSSHDLIPIDYNFTAEKKADLSVIKVEPLIDFQPAKKCTKNVISVFVAKKKTAKFIKKEHIFHCQMQS